MKDDKVNDELESLRSQLRELEFRREAQARSEAPAESADHGAETINDTVDDTLNADDLPEWLRELEQLDPDELLSQLREGALNWLQEFDEDLKDTRPSTLLVIFGLGVLVGKLTA